MSPRHAAVRARRIDVLVVESQSRVSRSLADSASVLDELRFLGVTLLGVSDGLDTRREDSDLMAGVNGAVNQQYLRKLGRETKRGMTQRARAQKVTGGRTFGYKSVDAPDGNGKVWMVDYNGWAYKMDPQTYDKQLVNIANVHYTYSDMTGGGLLNAVVPK